MSRYPRIGLVIVGLALTPGGGMASARPSSPLGELVGGGAGLDGVAQDGAAPAVSSQPALALSPIPPAPGAARFPVLHAMSLSNTQIRSIPIYRYPEHRARITAEIERLNPRGAMTILREVIDTDPDYAPAHAVLAIVIERHQPGTEEPRTLLETARQLAPESDVVRAADLEFFLLRGETRRCIEGALAFVRELQDAGQRVPVWPYELIVNSALREENASAALRFIDELLAADPDSLIAILSLANYVRLTNNYGPAVARYEAIVRRVRNPIARNNLAYLYSMKGRHREALPILEQLFAEYPDNIPVRDSLALVYHRLGENDKALVLLDAILAEAPRFAPAMLHRAMVLADLGRMEEAGEAFQRAILSDAGTLEESEVREARRKIP